MKKIAFLLLFLPVAALGQTDALPPPSPTTVKVINGVSYSANYSGSSLDVRVNACIVDAQTRTNGNTSGICDSSGEAGTQSILAPIFLGTSAQLNVTWKLPSNCNWTASGFPSNSTSAILTQHAGTTIIGQNVNWSQCTIYDTNAFIGAMYQTVEQTGYYRAEGFWLYNGGYTVAEGGQMVINGSYDTSLFANIGIINQTAAAAAILIQNPTGVTCCSTVFDRIQANSNNQGGPVLDIEGSSAGEPEAINFTNSTFTHPKSGSPVIKCNDTATLNAASINFFGTYLETNNTDTTTALIQNTGCGQLNFFGLTAVDPFASSTATLLTSSNAIASSIVVEGLKQYAGFSQPATAIVNNYTSETIQTDSLGQLSSYHSNNNYVTSISGKGTNVAIGPGLGLWGTYVVNQVLTGIVAPYTGKFVSLQVVNTDGGTCTTPPAFNIFDGTSNTGTALTATTSLQSKGNATSNAQTLAFTAGDNIGIYVSTAGASCVATHFAISAVTVATKQ